MKNSVSLLSSFKHAFDGIRYVLAQERNARIHFCVAIGVIVLAAVLHLDISRWALLLLAIGLVFTAEMVNTVVEILVDLVVQQIHPMAKAAKDVAAGAVLLMAVVAAVIGIIVLGPPLFTQLAELLQR
ncbi:MAG: diacylglycerol kinase family protein [Chloroflexi bacterium]|nr:diacylglycerol kinase family protein [Chloroflexota bacterium]